MQRTPVINIEFRNQKLIVVGGTSGISKTIAQLETQPVTYLVEMV